MLALEKKIEQTTKFQVHILYLDCLQSSSWTSQTGCKPGVWVQVQCGQHTKPETRCMFMLRLHPEPRCEPTVLQVDCSCSQVLSWCGSSLGLIFDTTEVPHSEPIRAQHMTSQVSIVTWPSSSLIYSIPLLSNHSPDHNSNGNKIKACLGMSVMSSKCCGEWWWQWQVRQGRARAAAWRELLRSEENHLRRFQNWYVTWITIYGHMPDYEARKKKSTPGTFFNFRYPLT